MTAIRDFLARFRPAPSPGRAAPGGVPADRSAELRAELAPPLALLEETEAQARTVRERADAAAGIRRREAERQAGQIVAEARAEALRVRRRAAEQAVRAAEAEAEALLAVADREAAAVRARAGLRIPLLADRVRALVLEDLAAQESPSREPGAGP
ncbi:hypothetical protein GCM10010269_23850 [Streptomyces humidus]|uniref:ATP synthase F0 subunit B n=1 Tax=Streptomyces humidus TaxID=52259 RepID=A0A918L3A4_9ACTN|nr:hypothetical protein [Streptomyces humidus]GGR83958.1 hypothetical protein GCM10010269_23850 [Streptomyces humidus]